MLHAFCFAYIFCLFSPLKWKLLKLRFPCVHSKGQSGTFTKTATKLLQKEENAPPSPPPLDACFNIIYECFLFFNFACTCKKESANFFRGKAQPYGLLMNTDNKNQGWKILKHHLTRVFLAFKGSIFQTLDIKLLNRYNHVILAQISNHGSIIQSKIVQGRSSPAQEASRRIHAFKSSLCGGSVSMDGWGNLGCSIWLHA